MDQDSCQDFEVKSRSKKELRYLALISKPLCKDPFPKDFITKGKNRGSV